MKNSATYFYGICLLATFSMGTGCGTPGGPRNSNIPLNANLYTARHSHASSYQEATQRVAQYDGFVQRGINVPEALKPGGAIVLTSSGKSISVAPDKFLSFLVSAKSGDVFKLGPGLYKVIGDFQKPPKIASGITIEGDGFHTLLSMQLVSTQNATFSNMTLVSADLSTPPPYRVWLENVRVVETYDQRVPSESTMPKGGNVVSILGGFYLRPFQCSASQGDREWNRCLKLNAAFDNYADFSLGTLALETDGLNSFTNSPELRPFFNDYLKFMKGGTRPSAVNADRAYKSLRSIIDADQIPRETYYYMTPDEVKQRIDLKRSSWVRLASVIQREFGSAGESIPPAQKINLLRQADADSKANRPLSALYFLQRLYSTNLSPKERSDLKLRIAASRLKLAGQFGTSIEYNLTAPLASSDIVEERKNREKLEGTYSVWIQNPVTSRYPITRIADSSGARFKVLVEQTRNDFSSVRSTQKVEERTYNIEDQSIKAAREKAAADAAWAKFQSTISNIDATASAIERTARTNYEQRVRIENNSSGQQLVWYDGKKNQGGLKLDSAPLQYEAPPPGMIQVTATTESILFNNVVNVSFRAFMKENGKVIDQIAPFNRTQSWNFNCQTKKTPNAFGVIETDSNCFGGTGGRKGADVVHSTMEEVFASWIFHHYETRVLAASLNRLNAAAKGKNKAEMAEMILLGRSLGIPSSKEQEAILKEVFDDDKAFDKVLAVTLI